MKAETKAMKKTKKKAKKKAMKKKTGKAAHQKSEKRAKLAAKLGTVLARLNGNTTEDEVKKEVANDGKKLQSSGLKKLGITAHNTSLPASPGQIAASAAKAVKEADQKTKKAKAATEKANILKKASMVANGKQVSNQTATPNRRAANKISSLFHKNGKSKRVKEGSVSDSAPKKHIFNKGKKKKKRKGHKKRDSQKNIGKKKKMGEKNTGNVKNEDIARKTSVSVSSIKNVPEGAVKMKETVRDSANAAANPYGNTPLSSGNTNGSSKQSSNPFSNYFTALNPLAGMPASNIDPLAGMDLPDIVKANLAKQKTPDGPLAANGVGGNTMETHANGGGGDLGGNPGAGILAKFSVEDKKSAEEKARKKSEKKTLEKKKRELKKHALQQRMENVERAKKELAERMVARAAADAGADVETGSSVGAQAVVKPPPATTTGNLFTAPGGLRGTLGGSLAHVASLFGLGGSKTSAAAENKTMTGSSFLEIESRGRGAPAVLEQAESPQLTFVDETERLEPMISLLELSSSGFSVAADAGSSSLQISSASSGSEMLNERAAGASSQAQEAQGQRTQETVLEQDKLDSEGLDSNGRSQIATLERDRSAKKLQSSYTERATQPNSGHREQQGIEQDPRTRRTQTNQQNQVKPGGQRTQANLQTGWRNRRSQRKQPRTNPRKQGKGAANARNRERTDRYGGGAQRNFGTESQRAQRNERTANSHNRRRDDTIQNGRHLKNRDHRTGSSRNTGQGKRREKGSQKGRPPRPGRTDDPSYGRRVRRDGARNDTKAGSSEGGTARKSSTMERRPSESGGGGRMKTSQGKGRGENTNFQRKNPYNSAGKTKHSTRGRGSSVGNEGSVRRGSSAGSVGTGRRGLSALEHLEKAISREPEESFIGESVPQEVVGREEGFGDEESFAGRHERVPYKGQKSLRNGDAPPKSVRRYMEEVESAASHMQLNRSTFAGGNDGREGLALTSIEDSDSPEFGVGRAEDAVRKGRASGDTSRKHKGVKKILVKIKHTASGQAFTERTEQQKEPRNEITGNATALPADHGRPSGEKDAPLLESDEKSLRLEYGIEDLSVAQLAGPKILSPGSPLSPGPLTAPKGIKKILVAPGAIEAPHSMAAPKAPGTMVSPAGIQAPGDMVSPAAVQAPGDLKSPEELKSVGTVRSPGKIKSPGDLESPGNPQTPEKVAAPRNPQSPEDLTPDMKPLSPLVAPVDPALTMVLPVPLKSPSPLVTPVDPKLDIVGPEPVKAPGGVIPPSSVTAPERVVPPGDVLSPVNPASVAAPEGAVSPGSVVAPVAPEGMEAPSGVVSPTGVIAPGDLPSPGEVKAPLAVAPPTRPVKAPLAVPAPKGPIGPNIPPSKDGSPVLIFAETASADITERYQAAKAVTALSKEPEENQHRHHVPHSRPYDRTAKDFLDGQSLSQVEYREYRLPVLRRKHFFNLKVEEVESPEVTSSPLRKACEHRGIEEDEVKNEVPAASLMQSQKRIQCSIFSDGLQKTDFEQTPTERKKHFLSGKRTNSRTKKKTMRRHSVKLKGRGNAPLSESEPLSKVQVGVYTAFLNMKPPD